MAVHFLLSPAAKTINLVRVARMSKEEAETTFACIRWSETDGKPVCPQCGSLNAYDCRRPNGAPRWRCRGCKADFSLTSSTLFASHKMPLQTYLLAIAIFVNEVKGKSALALSRDLGCDYKTAFVLSHKLREAMAEEMKGRVVGGVGKEAEVDAGWFGGYVKPANIKADRRDRRLARNQNGKRQASSSFASAAATASRRYSARKARLCLSSRPASRRAPSFTPMLRPRGTICTQISR